MEIERRAVESSLNIETRDEGRKVITGQAAVYNSRSQFLGFYEYISPGAFDGADLSDVRALWNHNTDHPSNLLGRTTSGTLRVSVNERGLAYEIDPPSDARALIERMERGDITESSFGFTIAKGGDEWDEDDEGNVIRTIYRMGKIFDVSPVVYPAYQDTDSGVAQRTFEKFMQGRKRAQEVLDIRRRELVALQTRAMISRAQSR